jgi:predicted peroxiredoxin
MGEGDLLAEREPRSRGGDDAGAATCPPADEWQQREQPGVQRCAAAQVRGVWEGDRVDGGRSALAGEQLGEDVERHGPDAEERHDQNDEVGRFHAREDIRMSTSPARRLVVKCTAGADDAERCSQAFTVAATALAAGAEVSLWLTGEAAWLALPGRAEAFVLPQAAPLADLRDAVIGGGRLTVCTQCAARRGIEQNQLVEGAVIAGSASFVDEVLAPGVQALVY